KHNKRRFVSVARFAHVCSAGDMKIASVLHLFSSFAMGELSQILKRAGSIPIASMASFFGAEHSPYPAYSPQIDQDAFKPFVSPHWYLDPYRLPPRNDP